MDMNECHRTLFGLRIFSVLKMFLFSFRPVRKRMKVESRQLIIMLVLCASAIACEQTEREGTRQSERHGTGQYFTENECPVVGNAETHIYHLPGDRNYGQMLEENKDKKKDTRVCFKSRVEAEKAGYRRSRHGKSK